MCYYETTDYTCGDWKWGNMKLRCPRQHRMGETCGAKLVHYESVTKSPNICRTCHDIDTKQRRLRKEQDNIARWSREGDRFKASIEKAKFEAQKLDTQIRELYRTRPKVKNEIQSQTAPQPAPGQVSLPPIGSMVETTSRPASTAQSGYGSYGGGYAQLQGDRHDPGYQPGGSSSNSGRHATGYSAAPSIKLSSSYNSSGR